jgi:hypothetical protein
VEDETQRARLEEWWSGLTEEQQAELLALEEGNVLPNGTAGPALTHALGVGPAGVAFGDGGEGYAFLVDLRLAGLLAEKRADTGGG